MISLKIQTAEVKHPLTPGQTRVVIQAVDENDEPTPVFLCCVEPPNTFERRMRESFMTICSVEDMAEYPVGVSSVREIDPLPVAEGTLLYCAQENKIYERGYDEQQDPAWNPYIPPQGGMKPNVHTHKLPFFRRSAIDVILPSRHFVRHAIQWIEDAVKQLERAKSDLEFLRDYP